MDRLAASLLASLALACSIPGPEDAMLNARIDGPALAVEPVALGTSLTGSFELVLELGPEAPGPVTIGLESFALARAGDRSTLLSPLSAAAQGASFPLELGKGQSRSIRFRIEQAKLLEPAERDAICAEPVLVTGVIRTNDEPKPVASAATTPAGC
jgi:hypothetical protein